MRQTDDEIRWRWGLQDLEPKSKGETLRLMNLIEAQRRRDEARGLLLQAEMALDDARKAMDDNAFREMTAVTPREPAPRVEAVSPSLSTRMTLDDLFERMKRRTAAFFARTGGRG